MNINQTRIDNLSEYVKGVLNKENGRELYQKYKSDIEAVTPQEAFEVFYKQIENGTGSGEIVQILDKVINIFYKSLSGYVWKRPEENSFLDYLLQENHALTKRLEEIKVVIKEKSFQDARDELYVKLKNLQKFNSHYQKKENILFPYLEKKAPKFNGLPIMWTLHDETRKTLKKVLQILTDSESTEKDFTIEVGKLFFDLYGLVQKEELILFPSASETICEEEWSEMQKQSLDYDFPFISGPEGQKPDQIPSEKEMPEIQEGQLVFKTETGVLTFEQILMIFNALPVDLTFVDENNKVKYFTRPKDRIFPRSPAIIGRDVEKCHPPESVHVVRRIVDAFRSGREDSASFWINLKGKLILIQYFALRDSQGIFRGTLEVSQDITGIKELEGERRLLHFE